MEWVSNPWFIGLWAALMMVPAAAAVTLEWRPPRWLKVISVLGMGALLALLLALDPKEPWVLLGAVVLVWLLTLWIDLTDRPDPVGRGR